ncbi:xylulokinase [Mammaliicoccus sp. Dog046]|uniref:xylulokinase n=1 Tax=Mammaliicoccus sp. Dog046 TaxID=3034233 RepID=UPI002B25C2CD|nr:xylulokinase [Mammaliicoccus sp. Dog046]WQK84787.1 xylulokinase [Mammaliicoccus sp. Dog046]
MSYVLGIDLGTSSLKGILMNRSGEVVAESSSEYPLDTPSVGYAEQHPDCWILACEKVLTQLTIDVKDFGSKLEAISFSGQMHSLVVLGEDHRPVYPAILWNDVRTTDECKVIEDKLGERLFKITKNRVLEGFTLPKILWLQKNEPETWSKVKKIMMPKDFLGHWFTGVYYTEFSDAAGTLLLDGETNTWSEEMASHFDIDNDQLPKLLESFALVGQVREDIKERFNLTNDVNVYAGGADNACAALGAGLSSDTGLVSIGTSGVFSAIEPEVKNYKGQLHFFNHVIPNQYYSMGVTLAAGNSLNWFKNTFAKGQDFSALLNEIYTVNPGSEGLLFTPYIVGERSPHYDSQIRGSFIGIDTHHELKHFSRAVLEGITFSLKDSQVIYNQLNDDHIDRLISVGGGSKNPDWMQIQADIFNKNIIRLEVEQGPGLGACMIAAIGQGWFVSADEAIEEWVNYKSAVFTPNQKAVEHYERVYSIWKTAYAQTKNMSHSLQTIIKYE